ncbi:hypothetical protein OEZ86_001515 [Tetradesmus obliquus]|nr:hypothetical protein OEZ86_001515 [Tetradesmus obliquus]
MVQHSSVQLLPSLTHALRAAALACNAALWCCSRAFSSSTPHLQQQQQQQETAEPLTGLAFDEVFVQQGGPYAGSSSSNGSEDQATQEPITAVFLHGLLGSSRNWRSFSRKLAQDAAARTNRDVRMLLVDLRCHGDSASRYGLHPPHSMAAAANDVAQLIKQQLGGQAPHLLAGLSLGGKALYKYLEPKGIPLPVAQWLGTSLVPGGRWGSSSSSSSSGNGNGSSDQQLDWVFDITGAAALYNSYRLSSYWDVLTQPPPGVVVHLMRGELWTLPCAGLSSYWDVLTQPPPGVVVHLVRGELSDRWTPHMLQQLADAEAKWQEASSEAPENVGELQLHVLEKAGHWLQADNPEGLAALMSPWLKDLHQARLLW